MFIDYVTFLSSLSGTTLMTLGNGVGKRIEDDYIVLEK